MIYLFLKDTSISELTKYISNQSSDKGLYLIIVYSILNIYLILQQCTILYTLYYIYH